MICNYNKCEYIIKCINAVLNSNYKYYDIYVVDNASSDNSVKEIKNNFENKITLIENKENLGGSGGFNTGIREALKKEYKYIMLLDNDAVVEEKSIKNSINYLDENKDVAMLGFKIYSMDSPNQIQEFGADIDFEEFTIRPYYKGYIDDGSIPLIKYCDYVPACAMIVRNEAIKTVGLMPEENFIYWDDIEWGHRFKLNNYKVIAYSNSIAWHKMGVKQKENTFGTYYFWRNRVKFFKRFCDAKQKEIFAEKIFNEMVQSVCTCNYNKKYNSASTIIQAVLDGIYDINEKADDNKILPTDNIIDKFEKMISKYDEINIIPHTDINHIRNIVETINRNNSNKLIRIITSNLEVKRQFKYNNVMINETLENDKDNILVIKTCDHILNLNMDTTKIQYSYVDNYFNTIHNSDDLKKLKSNILLQEMLNNIFYRTIRNAIIR